MMRRSDPMAAEPPAAPRRLTRRGLSLFVLLAMTAGGITLCAVVVSPFVPGLVWALALTVMALPVHRRVASLVKWPSVAAALSTALVALVLLVPTLFVVWQVGLQVGQQIERVEELVQSGALRQKIQGYPAAAWVYDTVSESWGSPEGPSQIMAPVGTTARSWLASVGGAILQLLVALFALFFLLRDRARVLEVVRSFLPMSRREADEFLASIGSMTHATIYGTVAVSFIQGALGGLMFALLGIPAALLWAVVMSILSIIPSAGAFLVWLPAALLLGAQGETGKAMLLAAWGVFAVGTIDNVLYPRLVGKEMRLHTLPVFLAIVGGLFVFGAAGIVLGPVSLSATIALLHIIRRRTSHGRPAERPIG